MGDVLGLGVDLPSFSNKGQEVVQQSASNPMTMIWILIAVVLMIIGAIIIFLIYQSKIYNRKIIVFENISGLGYQVAFRDKARLIKVGDGGEEILFLKKKKTYRTAYGRKMGKNTYWFAVGQDGYWYNCTIGDLDTKMGMLDIEPIDRDMRYMHVAIRKNIQERYHKISFMEKYGTILMSGIFLLIMIVGIFILLGKMGKIADSINAGITSSAQVTKSASEILSALDNILNGGSGITPAGLTPAG